MALFAGDVKKFVAPFKHFAAKTALSVTYRTMLLMPDRVVGCGMNGMMESFLELGIDQEVHIASDAFMALCESLPNDKKLKLRVEDDALHWECGYAKGKLAKMIVDNYPRMPARMPKSGWTPALGFIDGLRVGALSCEKASAANQGMHGLDIMFGDDHVNFGSSDNTTVSLVTLDPVEPPANAPKHLVIAPEAAHLLADLIAEDGQMEFSDRGLLYWDSETRLLLKPMAAIKKDLSKVASKFGSREAVAAIPPERIAAFVKRTVALSEMKRDALVTVRASNGQLTLEFSGDAAASEEMYMVEGLELPGELEVRVDGYRMARALEHLQSVALDYVESHRVLVFLGDDPNFVYLVAGRED